MYEKIVVPLDGSKLAESVLPHVEKLAKGTGVKEVILVSVTERVAGYRPAEHSGPVEGHPPRETGPQTVSLSATIPYSQPITMVPERENTTIFAGPEAFTSVPVVVGKKEKQANRYLDRIATRLEKKKINVRTQVLIGHPAEQIASYAKEAGVDLILMASHGRSGIGRWALGSVADKVFRMSPLPVLMVKCPGSVVSI